MELKKNDIEMVLFKHAREADDTGKMKQFIEIICEFHRLLDPTADPVADWRMCDVVFCGSELYLYLLEKLIQHDLPLEMWFKYGFQLDGSLEPWEIRVRRSDDII